MAPLCGRVFDASSGGGAEASASGIAVCFVFRVACLYSCSVLARSLRFFSPPCVSVLCSLCACFCLCSSSLFVFLLCPFLFLLSPSHSLPLSLCPFQLLAYFRFHGASASSLGRPFGWPSLVAVAVVASCRRWRRRCVFVAVAVTVVAALSFFAPPTALPNTRSSAVAMSENMLDRRAMIGNFAAVAALAPAAAFADGASSAAVTARSRALYGSRVVRLQNASPEAILEEKNGSDLMLL